MTATELTSVDLYAALSLFAAREPYLLLDERGGEGLAVLEGPDLFFLDLAPHERVHEVPPLLGAKNRLGVRLLATL
jgi:hypothetical protein